MSAASILFKMPRPPLEWCGDSWSGIWSNNEYGRKSATRFISLRLSYKIANIHGFVVAFCFLLHIAKCLYCFRRSTAIVGKLVRMFYPRFSFIGTPSRLFVTKVVALYLCGHNLKLCCTIMFFAVCINCHRKSCNMLLVWTFNWPFLYVTFFLQWLFLDHVVLFSSSSWVHY